MVLGGTTGAVKGKDWQAWFQILKKQARHPLISKYFALKVDGVLKSTFDRDDWDALVDVKLSEWQRQFKAMTEFEQGIALELEAIFASLFTALPVLEDNT